MANEYDIVRAFQRIEEELIASMKRNLSRHIKEEQKENFSWSMWQAEQLKSLEEFKKQNPKLFKKYFSTVDKEIEEVLKKAYESGQADEEIKILEAFKKDKIKKTKSSFFKVNDRKLKALIEEAQAGINKASLSILRFTNDKYRKMIFNAQVYANSGAGTIKQAVDMATKDFLSAGINSVEYSNGNRVNIASYAEMAIRTASKRAYTQGEGAKRDEWGIHTVLVHNRGGGCPYCIKYQGRVFIDDVWSGGTKEESKELGYPLLSTAIAGGLFHPNCKDTITTYFPGISSIPKVPTKSDLEEKIKSYKVNQKLNYINLNIEKYKRLEQGSLDKKNIEKYHNKRVAWQQYKKKFKENNNLGFYDALKDDIMNPTYIRMNLSNDYNPINEVEAINSAIMELPSNIQKEIRKSNIEIFTKGQIINDNKIIQNSFYDRKNDIIHIYQGADKYEVIHEIGHMIETRMNVLNDTKYIQIRNKGLENYTIDFVVRLKNYENTQGIKSSKFISEFQGKIYKTDLNGKPYILKNKYLNLNCLGDYFSEGFREYFENKENLKSHDEELYCYIKELINGKL